MKRSIVLLIMAGVICSSIGLLSQVYDWHSAIRAGDDGRDIIWDIAVDNSGNTYVVGIFSVQTSLGDIELEAKGETDILAAKLDPHGNWVWAVRAGGTSFNNGHSITIDEDNNVYITGDFWEDGDFGDTILTGGGGFIAKLDTDGNWIWAKKAGSSVKSAAVCSQSNVFLTGSFNETANFGDIELVPEGRIDIFVAQIESNGDWVWAQRAGGGSTGGVDSGEDIVVDNNGNVFVTGQFSGRGDFGDIRLRSDGLRDLFVAKLDNEGNWLWAERAGGESHIISLALTLDEEKNCYITGSLFGTAYFGETELQEVHTGWGDLYVAKIDSEGNWIWANQANAVRGGGGHNIIFNDNCLYVTGTFRGPALFDEIKIDLGRYVLLAEIDTDGNWSSLSMGTITGENSYCFSTGLAIDKHGLINIAGHFFHTLTFGNFELKSTGRDDMFIAKLGLRESSDIEDIVDIEANCTALHSFVNTRIKIQFDGDNPAQRITSWFFNIHPGEFGEIYPPESPVTNISPGFWYIQSSHQQPGTFDLTLYAANIPGAGNPGSLHLLKRENPSTPWHDKGKPDEINDYWLRWKNLSRFQDFTFGGYGDNFFPVELSSFTAEVTSEGHVRVQWISEKESNLLGYNLYRTSADDLADAIKINPEIISATNTSEPKKYKIVDDSVSSGKVYYYWLQIKELDQVYSFFGPIRIKVEDESSVPLVVDKTTLHRNYPNPFNPETTIRFSLRANKQRLKLSIYDIKGRLIRRLIPPGPHKIGEYRVVWDGKDEFDKEVASGVYFYRLTTDSHTEQHKMMLVK